MGFDDEDFYKARDAGISNTQLYKQAGNSIVVNVLERIFNNLFKGEKKMKPIITEEVLDQVWESGHKRVMELVNQREKYPTLTKQIDGLKREYIICMNAVSVRDYNKIEKTRVTINKLESELKDSQQGYDAEQRRSKKAQEIKESLTEVINKESEENNDGE